MLFVRKLIWNTWNIAHIARHRVSIGEVEEICHGQPIVLRGQQKGRLVLIGQTVEKRILGVILEGQGKNSYYPITAYDADARDSALYHRLRGGEDNETNKE